MDTLSSNDGNVIPSSCELCGAVAPVKYVQFFQNIGLVLFRIQKTVKGKFCKKCILNTFLHTTLITFFFGWISILSLFIAPIFVVHNIIRYLTTLGLKAS